MDDKLIAALEKTEQRAWEDMYLGAPADFRQTHALRSRSIGDGLVLTSTGLHLAHFNSVLGLGTEAPVSDADLDAILDCFRSAGAPKFYVHTIAETQRELEQRLEHRGLRLVSSWDRVFRDGSPMTARADRNGVEVVTGETAVEWAAFLDAAYHLPTGPWLRSLVGRTGWRHYALREGGMIVAVRSMFIDQDRRAWFGIDAPVPGIMTTRHDRDHKLCAAMVADGLEEGVTGFAADIEKPSADRTGPAYDAFGGLGFTVPYLRHKYMP